jgi:hypothetical protein
MSILRCGDSYLCTDVTPLTNNGGVWRIKYEQQNSGVPIVSAYVEGPLFEPITTGSLVLSNSDAGSTTTAVDLTGGTTTTTSIVKANDYENGHFTPVPEPSYSMIMLAVCMAAALMFDRRPKEPRGSCKCAEDHTDGTGICWECRKTRVIL